MSRTVLDASTVIHHAGSAGAGPATPSSGLIPLSTGVTLHYAVQGDPGGEPLVFLHGISDSWHSWKLVLPYLPPRFRAYAVSLRGHGMSDAPASGYRQTDFGGDVAAFMEALDLQGVTLVGHSLGSFVAQAVAAADRDRLRALVLVGSGPGGLPDPVLAGEVRAAFEAVAADRRHARDFQGSTIARPVPAEFFETMVRSAEGLPPHVWRQVAEASVYSPDTDAALAAVRVPTLIVWGRQDAMLRRPEQDALLAKIRDARLLEYEGTGHTPQWEWPDRFAADLVAFVSGLGTPAAPAR